jgi:NAD(P)-dependent dehydrogenase (short-subunit alcohol dehydrogenase family)
MVSFDIKDRVALVTGASRGIGRAIAETLAEQGAETVLVSRRQESLDLIAAGICEKGGKAAGFACNMGSLADMDDLFGRIREQYGRLDILVNNAATNPYFGEMAAIDETAWEKTLDVNLKGPFFMIQKAVPLMRAAGKGAIVNVSSVNGIRPAAFQGVYSITKGALITMTRAFAKELAPRQIRVNALLPGFTDTQFSSVLMQNKEIYDMVIEQIPLKRHADPVEMAGAVLYLVSDAASYTTGACLTCDGGLLA